MNKRITIMLLSLFFAASIGYAKVDINHQTKEEKTPDMSGGFFNPTVSPEENETADEIDRGFFRDEAGNPGTGLPDGGAIGQPLGDSLGTLITCCVVWGIVISITAKRKKTVRV